MVLVTDFFHEDVAVVYCFFQIPASAVEMPGSADVTGLNVQFGALEFGSEPALPEFGSAPSNENTSQAPTSSLYSKPVKYVCVPLVRPCAFSARPIL